MKVLIIGGTAAGLSAASRIRRNQPDWTITVYEKSAYIGTGSCGLPYFVGGLVRDMQSLMSFTPETLREKRNIQALIRHEVLDIDRAHKTLRIRDIVGGAVFEESYDKLVIATGARALLPSIPGIEGEGIFTLRTLDDALAVRGAIERGAKKAIIIGGGMIGLETAEQLHARGLQVEIAEARNTLLPDYPPEYAQMLQDTLKQHSVRLHLGAVIQRIAYEGGRLMGVELENGMLLPADIVIVAAGIAPNSEIAQRAGLSTGYRKGIVVDAHMRTEDASIWACGDCVQMHHIIAHAPTHVPLGTTANKQGRVAGDAASGGAEVFPGIVGAQVTKVFDRYIAAAGLSRAQAEQAGFDAAENAIVKYDRAEYYPGGTNCHMNIVLEKKSGTLLGAQAMGGESVAGRMNVLVAAMTAKMTAAQLAGLDLVYTPSVAPVYDPLIIAATEAGKKV